MTNSIDCWLTLGSTYTYLSVMRLPAIAREAGIGFRLRPFNLRLLFDERGYFPFPPDAPKTQYMWRDLARRAQRHGLGIRLPVPYPAKGSQLANKVAIVGLREDWGDAFVRASYRLWFAHGVEAGSEENLRASLAEVGADHDRVLAAAQSPETERILIEETRTAQQLGVFGAPTFAVDGELFWGDDRLEDAVEWAIHGRLREAPAAG